MNTNRQQPTRRSSREIKRKLRSIYEGVDGRVPDLTKLDRGDKSRFTRLLLKSIALLAVISAIAWVGFFLFTQGIFHDDETLKLTIDGPTEIKSGEEVSYTFRYENIGTVPIASLIMRLNIPLTFHIYTTIPETNGGLEWTIGSLNSGSDGAITITGVFLADVPSSQRLQALFTYKPANFSSDFQDIVTQKIDINDSVIALSFNGPEKALAGDTSEYVVNVQNTSTRPIYNIRVIPNLPEDFSITSTEPSLEEEQTYWIIDALEPGELKAVTLNGTFTSTATGEQTIGVSTAFVENDVVYTQSSEEMITDVLSGSISFSTIINGSTQSQVADLGETLRLSLDYSNNGEEVAENMSFNLTISSEEGEIPIDWERANLGNGVRDENTIAWDQLEALQPGESAVIDIGLPIFDELESTQTDVFSVSVTLTLNKLGTVESTRTLEVTPIVISLNSDVSVNALAMYYAQSGSTIGTGPIPPQVGQTTTYRVYWNISNSLHTLENIQISATLPQDITWLEQTDTDIGTVEYNTTTRQVTWTIPKLLSELGHAGAWFEIATTPKSSDIGHYMKLTSSTSFEAKDTQTLEPISNSVSELTTELPDDEFALGKGVVIE